MDLNFNQAKQITRPKHIFDLDNLVGANILFPKMFRIFNLGNTTKLKPT